MTDFLLRRRTICCLLIATVDLVCFVSFFSQPLKLSSKRSAACGAVMKPLVLTLKITVSQRSPSQIYSSWTHRKCDLKTLLFCKTWHAWVRPASGCHRVQPTLHHASRWMFFFLTLIVIGLTMGLCARASLSLSTLTAALPLPAGRWRCLGGGHLDLDREERLHQPAVLQDVRCLHLHTGPGRSRRHGNGRAGLLRHLQGAQEAAASGERLRHATHMVHK